MVLVKVSDTKLNIDLDERAAIEKALKIAGIKKENVRDSKIIKYSVDARHKDNIKKIYTVGLYVDKYVKNRKNVTVINHEKKYKPEITGNSKLNNSPVVVGFGPAGMFLGYMLAEYGYKPIIIERGSKVEERIKKVEKFWNTGELDTNCNVQFGEGGAGTFSDGKLNTGIKDKFNRIGFVLDTFVKFGADKNITYDAKPHIGTDILAKVVENMRKYIESKGGTFYFDTAFTGFTTKEGNLESITLNGNEKIYTDICTLAIGHSARDTFEMLYENHVNMEQKPFAVGVRIEHKQSTINKSQYGFEDNRLGAANYKLTYNTSKNRGVYSFCMCPGGYVVNSASEKNRTVVNGMSYSKRDGENANSALVVTVTPKDFDGDSPLAGVEFQRRMEEKAYEMGQGFVPVQTYRDYKDNCTSVKIGNITPQIKGNYRLADLNAIFPEYINESLKEGIEYFGEKIKGYNDGDVILSAVESRTSSPVRIVRDENFQSNVYGLIPAGEGAGYAGGITSAAIDGLKIFEYIASKYKPVD